MRSWDAFQESPEYVISCLEEGRLDYLEIVSRVEETKFFRYMLEGGDLERLANEYPTPRKKHEVPVWLYLASQLTLRLHGAPGFSSYPYIIHCGGLRDALESGQVARKATESGDSRVEYAGYNSKNSYSRRTPCDQDYVRKFARDTRPQLLEEWFGSAVARYLNERGAYDSDGIFMIDGSYLFVPDNSGYEGSQQAFFDKHNRIVSKDDEAKLSPAERKHLRLRRYYKMTALSHTNRESEYLLYAGVKMVRKGGAEINQLVPLVEEFVASVGEGVMKLLVIDRGFIDGEDLTRIKKDFKVDWLVPLKAGMDVTNEAWRLAEIDGEPWREWVIPEKEPPPDPPQRPARISKAEKARQATVKAKKAEEGIEPKPRIERIEFKVVPQITLWESCDVPVNAVVMREYKTDGECSTWGLMTTRKVDDPKTIRDLYHIRASCEEGWRQTKCFWDLTHFRSTTYSLVVNQVAFVLLAYSLFQLFLLKSERGELAKATRKRLLSQLLPEGEKVAVYCDNHVGFLRIAHYSDILLNLKEGPRRRLASKVKALRKSQNEPPQLPERPTP